MPVTPVMSARGLAPEDDPGRDMDMALDITGGQRFEMVAKSYDIVNGEAAISAFSADLS
jgi:hypothetical protein